MQSPAIRLTPRPRIFSRRRTIAFRSDRDGGGVYLIPSRAAAGCLPGRASPPAPRWVWSPIGRTARFCRRATGALGSLSSPRRQRPAGPARLCFLPGPIQCRRKESALSGRADSAHNEVDATDWFIAQSKARIGQHQGLPTVSTARNLRQYGIPGAWREAFIFGSDGGRRTSGEPRRSGD